MHAHKKCDFKESPTQSLTLFSNEHKNERYNKKVSDLKLKCNNF